MLLFARMMTPGGVLRLVAHGQQLQLLFNLTCTDATLTILPDEAAALAD